VRLLIAHSGIALAQWRRRKVGMGSATEDSREEETQMRKALERAPPIGAIGASNVVRVAIPADGSIGLDTIRVGHPRTSGAH